MLFSMFRDFLPIHDDCPSTPPRHRRLLRHPCLTDAIASRGIASTSSRDQQAQRGGLCITQTTLLYRRLSNSVNGACFVSSILLACVRWPLSMTFWFGGTMTRTVESLCQLFGMFYCIFAICISKQRKLFLISHIYVTTTPSPSFPITRDALRTRISLVGASFGLVPHPHINIVVEYLFYDRFLFFFQNIHIRTLHYM